MDGEVVFIPTANSIPARFNNITVDVEVTEDILQTFLHVYKHFVVSDTDRKQEFERDNKAKIKAVIQHVLSTPPLTSVVRINTLNTSDDHFHMLRESINEGICTEGKPGPENQYDILKVDEIKDALFVTSNKIEKIVKAVPKEVIVGELCGCAVLRGADVFAPGIIAAYPGMKKGDVVSVYADVQGGCRRGLTTIYTGTKYFLGNALAQMSRKELFVDNINSGIALKMIDAVYQLPSFSHLSPSLFFPQNLPSLIVGHVLDPRPEDLILDMCASPGGKTTHIAQLTKDKARIIAIDKTAYKVNKLEDNFRKLGLTSTRPFVFDSTKLCDTGAPLVVKEHGIDIELSPPFPAGLFDKVLLDPPCSALGQRPRLSCKMSSRELNSYPIYQRKLIRQGILLLRVGGILVYSTCTTTIEENENQVQWILEHFPELKLDKQKLVLGLPGIKNHKLSDEHCELVQRFDRAWTLLHYERNNCQNVPKSKIESIAEDCIGFFIAKFVKTFCPTKGPL